MNGQVSRQLRGKCVRDLEKWIILSVVGDEGPIHGYGIAVSIHKKHGILISSGTIYPCLHSFKKKGLVKSEKLEGKIVYTLTEAGEETVKISKDIYNSILRSYLER